MPARILFLLLIFALSVVQTRAQVYEPGLLVRANGDTLRGEIENNFWTEPPTLIRFRTASKGPVVVFKPRQLRAVCFNDGRRFRYEALPIDYAAETRLDRLPQRNFTNIRTDSLLAEVLVEGPASLLRVALLSTTHYLVRRTGQPVLDMSERRYVSQVPNGASGVIEGNNFKSQLLLYFGDCPAASGLAQKVAFTPDALAAVVQAYNERCSSARQPGQNWLAQINPRRSITLVGGVLAGAKYSRLERATADLTAFCPDCQLRPFAGLYGEVLQPGRAWALYGELSLNPFRDRATIERYAFEGPKGSVAAYAYSFYDYAGWLGTARLSLRYFVALPRKQQLLLGMGGELNAVVHRTVTAINYTTSDLAAPLPSLEVPASNPSYAAQTLLPSLTLGWRSRRLTFFADGQFYYGRSLPELSAQFSGDDFVVRLGSTIQLGRRPDASLQTK